MITAIIGFVIRTALRLTAIVLMIQFVLNLIKNAPQNPWTTLLRNITEPIIRPARNVLARVIPSVSGKHDWTPAICALVLILLAKLF